jgi:hypothetical protein
VRKDLSDKKWNSLFKLGLKSFNRKDLGNMKKLHLSLRRFFETKTSKYSALFKYFDTEPAFFIEGITRNFSNLILQQRKHSKEKTIYSFGYTSVATYQGQLLIKFSLLVMEKFSFLVREEDKLLTRKQLVALRNLTETFLTDDVAHKQVALYKKHFEFNCEDKDLHNIVNDLIFSYVITKVK